jgi:uncharacterized membrane protein YsdA (DUF1294 family)
MGEGEKHCSMINMIKLAFPKGPIRAIRSIRGFPLEVWGLAYTLSKMKCSKPRNDRFMFLDFEIVSYFEIRVSDFVADPRQEGIRCDGVPMAQVIAQRMAVSKDFPKPRSVRQRVSRWAVIGSSLWLAVAVLLSSLLMWGTSLSCPWVVAMYLGATVLGSAVCFLAYGLDKRRAAADRWRISEATLQWLAFLGGWPGGVLGQRMFRHKTQKLPFQFTFWLIVSLHVPLVLISLWSMRFGG